MKSRGKQRHQVVPKKRTEVSCSSGDDEDSDVEKNFALLTNRGDGTGELDHQGEEEEDRSDEEEGDEEESDGRNVDSEGSEEEEGSDGQVEGSDDGDDDDDDDDDDHDETGGVEEIQTKEDIRKELSNMSFEEIMKLQNQVGTKVYNEVAYGSKKSQRGSKKKRLNKNRPVEMSAKKPTPLLRQVVPVKKSTMRDPRFDDLSGEYKPEIFETTYKFINEIKHKEKEIVQKRLMKMKKNNPKKEKLHLLLKRLENQERERLSREKQRDRELQFKRQQRERANHGDAPFFLKKSDKKKLQLADKYLELKKRGKLETFLSKKRKRNAGKDRKKLPQQPQDQKAS
ncbi:ribosomal RNA processing protein 36 homolog [Austrofundulus limnaeus]|uniref:rRNA biogenesis protein RRP36 n=1 Tax=Austrofundulus limnaeus TaxID=52670 RepID=A0A2I4CZG9_AUSLI|nr:PREDICTED: ribosomal RNA processing protein 36 homolog [Austrofundulus limnaeus]